MATTARALGRDTTGDVKAALFWNKMGAEWVEDGLRDGTAICAALQLHFVNKYTATSVKLLRSKANNLTIREGLRAAAVDEDRWPGSMDTLADHLALDFVTPPPARLLDSSAMDGSGPTPSTAIFNHEGGLRTSKYLEAGDDTLSVELARTGQLYDTHLFPEDFVHLRLPMQVQDKHVKHISKAALEAVVHRYKKVNWGIPFEEVLGRDLTNIHGECPQRSGINSKKRRRRSSVCREETSGDEEMLRRAWDTVMHCKVINLRKSNARVRRASPSRQDRVPQGAWVNVNTKISV